MEKVIYSNSGGLGIILDSYENEEDYFLEKEYMVVGKKLIPNEFTTLEGMFSKAVRYIGVYKDDKNLLCFHLGNDGDLFPTKYYSCFFWLHEHRIANKYAEGTCRDFKWIDGKWK